MKKIGIRDLRDHATQLLHENEVLLIQRHGKDVGVYVPLDELDALPLEVRLRLFQRITDEIGQVAGRRGITEAALVRRFKNLTTRKKRGH